MKYSMNKSHQQVVIVTCSNANSEMCTEMCEKNNLQKMEVNSVLSGNHFFQCHSKEAVMNSETIKSRFIKE